MKQINFFYITFFSILLFSCSKDLEPKAQDGLEYIPLSIGNYWVYDVIEIHYSSNYSYSPVVTYADNYSDTLTYQLKEELAESSTDLENNLSFNVNRYKRNNENEEWKLDSVWQSKIVNNLYIRNENNINFVKLNFPIEINKSWNTDIYNTINRIKNNECESTHYELVEEKINTNLNIENTVSVIFCNDSNALRNHQDIEYYAQNIGLIYKKTFKYEFCVATDTFTNISCNNLEIIDNGIKIEQKIVEFNVE